MADRIVGRIPVLECLRAGKRKARRLYLLRGAKGLNDVLAAATGLPIEERPRHELDQLSGGINHQGVVLDADALPLHRLEDWATGVVASNAVAVVLDGVEDPRNFGAIIRSAAAFGAWGVIFGKDRSAPLSTATQKAAAGAVEHIDLVQTTNLSRGIQTLQAEGFWVMGLDAAAQQTIWEADVTGRVAFVIGSEGKGLHRLVRERCDLLLSIPISGAVPSLNASISAAVALAEYARRRAGSSSALRDEVR